MFLRQMLNKSAGAFEAPGSSFFLGVAGRIRNTAYIPYFSCSSSIFNDLDPFLLSSCLILMGTTV